MAKNILVFNVGSSSIRYSMFKSLRKISQEKYDKLKSREDYKRAFIDLFKNIQIKKIKIDLIIHRVVHGGELKKPVIITKQIKKQIKIYSELAPLHNPIQLMIINLSEKFKKPQYAVFDTLFFSNLPDIAKIYPIDIEITKKYKIRKYGFHGLSHKSVSKNLKGKTITCHIGEGVSISAIKDKRPLDTTMGFTPLEGLMMGSRSGSIDPGLIIFLEKRKLNVEKLLNLESGLKGISGYSDFRDVRKNLNKKQVKLAYDMFLYKIIKQIGAYVSALNGLDNLVFTGAIGVNASGFRKNICKKLKYLNLKLDEKKNKLNEQIISSKDSKIKVYVRPPKEEEEMVREVLRK